MKIIGITGSSGSGKSTVCKIIKKYLNLQILDADKIVKDLTSQTSEYLLEIVKLFGQDILNEEKTLNRKLLANIIYNDIEAKQNLDKITFKFVCKKIEEEIETLKKNSNLEYVLVDAPLLFESDFYKKCDYIISVIADKNIKINRICLRDNLDKETALKRLNIQKEDDYYISNSDFVIENNDNEEMLENQIKEICNKIKRM